MFGKSKKTPLPPPSHETVAKLAVDALLGSLTMDLSTGYALVSLFKKYNADEAAQALALRAFADQLSALHPRAAGQLVDMLAERVGK